MIESIEFKLLSPSMIKRMAAVEITKADLYDNDGFPIEGGVMDPRLGVIDPGLRCRTCGGNIGECFGHFGYIEFVRPVLHVLYIKIIYKILKSVCLSCGKLAEAKKKCPHCGEEHKPVKFEKPYSFKEGEKTLDPVRIRSILEKISDEDLAYLGFKGGRPEWLILTLLPVPPVTARPSITLETGERSEDDLTHKLVDIIRINQRLKENMLIGAPDFIIEDLWELLQYHTATFFDNELSGIPQSRHRSGRALKTLAQRLKTKEGRFRQNLAGKRVNFSARTVISPDTSISLNEVGVPVSIASELTLPVVVSENNIETLRRIVLNAEQWPGANYIIRPDGRRKKISKENAEEIAKEISPGYTVERHLNNGDIVLFNRQPSLHKMSMMAHRVRVTPWHTLTLNTTVCVAPDTKVLLGGTQRKIEELKNCWKESQVITYDSVNKSIMATELKAFWGLKPEQYGENCYKITTETGREIIATGDHPFYTRDGIKPAKELSIGEKLVIYPMEFPEYEQTDFEIVSENDIISSAPKETYIKYALGELKSHGLIPLRLLNNPKAIILARLLGHLFGDGTFILNKDVSRAIFRGDKEDLKDIQRDIKFLGFEPERIVTKSSKGEIKTSNGKILNVCGIGSSFEMRSKPFGVLLKALGAPYGDKVKSDFSVPLWIKKAPNYIKKEFLSAYFGCELSKPKIRKSCKKMFKELVFKLSKVEDKIDSSMKFVEDVIKILNEFGIEAKISKENGNMRKDGTKTVVIKTTIRSDIENLIAYFGKIGYCYNASAENIARLAYAYLKAKKVEIEKRRIAFDTAHEMRKNGHTLKEISKKLNIPFRTVDFSDFESWVKKATEGLTNGFVFENIKNIDKVDCPYVFDITTSTETHNFIANGFLTKNCPPYNADFDGDEMNLHAIQTEEAQAEAAMLMEVQKHIRSPRFGGPIIGCEQDHISGTYLLTRKDTVLSRAEVFSLLQECGLDVSLPEKKTFSGKEVFSFLLPKGLNIEFKAKACPGCNTCKKEKCPHDCYVIIENGKMKAGVIDMKAIGREIGKLIDIIEKTFGSEVAHKFIDSVSLLGIKYLQKRGFTLGLDDLELSQHAISQIKGNIEKVKSEVNSLIQQYVEGKIDVLPGMTPEESLELHILRTLKNVSDSSGEILTKDMPENSAIVMAKSGARGGIAHLTQIAACVGQKTVLGKRIHRGFYSRILPHFLPKELSAEAHGFVTNSYRSGLNIFEFFFDLMSGRENLMDKSLRTKHSGYMERRLMNALQDLKVEYDYTVRDNRKVIIQFTPGEDRLDPSKSEWGSLNIRNIVQSIL